MPEAVAAARAVSVPDAFRSVVLRHGDRCALEEDGTRVTYAELDRRSNQVAHKLLAEGGTQPLAMVAPLAPESVIVMLGAMKAGRPIAPLDPRDPPDRTRAAVQHLGARLIAAADVSTSHRDDDPHVALSGEDPALIYFTSGSAGRATALVRHHAWVSYPTIGHGITADDRAGAILPLAFGGSVSNVFGPLFAGGTACFFDPVTQSLDALADWIEASRITCFQTAPSTLEAIAAALDARGRTAPSVRLVIIGGEPCEGRQLEVPRRVLPQATIANHYAATEASFIAVTRIRPGDPLEPGPVLFRHVYPDQTLTIVDETGREVLRGDAGELRVCSPRVALGYAGLPPEEGREFVEVKLGWRSIQLRDRARLHRDGTLELVGRTDLRVKVHGQSVDLEVIEQALRALPGVEAAVVSLVSGRHGQSRLVAHVAGEVSQCAPRELRLALSTTLPLFAIPAMFVQVDEVPRNSRGKIDRALLRGMAESGAPRETEDVAPRTSHEKAIADLVAGVLGLTRIGIHDDIFDLGADSLTLVGMLAAISDRLGVIVSLADLLVAPTVQELAALVERQRGPHSRVIALMHRSESGAPMFWVPGAGVGVIAARRLGQKLGRPVYSFVPHGFDRRAWPDRTIARAAARYVAALRDVQPEGPYVIAGVSFGCLVAFEMAQQLAAGGADLAWLILVDPVTSASTSSSFVKPLRRLRAERAGVVPSNGPFGPRLAGRLKRLFTDRYRPLTAGIVQRPPPAQAAAFLSLNRQMTRRYRPSTYAGRVLLLRTAEWQWFDELDITGSLSGETHVRTISGRHDTMLREPHVSALAAIIREEAG